MRLSGRQQKAVEKITGRPWTTWNREALAAYFAYTDQGKEVRVSKEAETDLYELKFSHRFHPVDVEQWKEDFKRGLLFLTDFTDPLVYDETTGKPIEGFHHPRAYLEHVFEVYEQAAGYETTYLKNYRIKHGLTEGVI